MLIGAIGDDFTGSTDLALTLGLQGMRTIQYLGIPGPDEEIPAEVDGAVVALKSRTAPLEEAVSQSLLAAEWLLAQGAAQLFFKYCSTFDSTAKGNIGPVAAALLDRLGEPLSIACPAFPTNGRTVFQGHLFVGDELLSESGMEDHPLTPMTDPDLVRFLGRQLPAGHRTGLVPFAQVDRGAEAIAQALAGLIEEGTSLAVVDALTDQHLLDIGRACADLKLITGGSGVAMGLPENFRRQGRLKDQPGLEELPKLSGGAAVLAGSCSLATRGQVEHLRAEMPSLKLDPLKIAQGHQGEGELKAWLADQPENAPVLIYSSSDPAEVARSQEKLGRNRAGEIIEQTLALAALALRQQGVDKFIVAGGETSGAVVSALGVKALRIGPEIEPGVPWTFSHGGEPVCLALKSGNFGSRDFFSRGLEMLP